MDTSEISSKGKEGYGKGYGKRPLWQWVVIYLIIGAIVYGLIYYLVLAKKGGTPYTAPGNTQQKSGY